MKLTLLEPPIHYRPCSICYGVWDIYSMSARGRCLPHDRSASRLGGRILTHAALRYHSMYNPPRVLNGPMVITGPHVLFAVVAP
ncbi:hypothetical protein AURDEDRAFT_116688 [Auricularia subglabra TFB-10046 SS5]|uniref:Uncharacterized protein n=1 Tax=Auricularia subglabra (strain TFB-10046 / SS5) TaxID=717982 RepID=J0DB09_AURST|nr:hypothetical protein AURDEDRAFT_116688 [Auricularia subglabra TFB-10046 SS5]